MTAPQRSTRQRSQGPRHVPLGRYAGVSVRAHWSLLLIAALATQLLAVSILPATLPGQHPAAYWTAGAAAAVVFLGAVLAHELAHALTARRYGLPVKQVTLWVLGGVTELGRDADNPRAEAAVAASGPATSLALGGAFAGLAWLIPGPGLLTATLAWLGGINLLLGLFNLLPGAPLDGGRLLRALLWRRYRDPVRAAESSARAGWVLGVLLIAAGILQLVTGAIFGLWLAVIGWVILGAANVERHAAAGRRLGDRVARDIMTTPPVTAPSWWTVTDFVTHLGTAPAAAAVYPLVDFDGRPRSLLTLRDIHRVPPQDRDTTRLRDAVRPGPGPLVVAPDTRLSELPLVIRAHGGIAVVVEDDRVVGTISDVDLATTASLAALQAGPDGSDARPSDRRAAPTGAPPHR